jgi:CMP-N-acetylneuraminic acid synthetase
MRVAAIVPARGGSKSIKKKNIVKLDGRPLIEYTLTAASKSKYITKTFVATEDLEIASACYGFDIEIYRRSKSSCRDDSLTQELLNEMYHQVYELRTYDRVILLQPTSPLRTTQHIDEALELSFSKADKTTTVISIQKVPHQFNPEQVFEVSDNFKINPTKQDLIRRRQDKKQYYARNGAAIYIFDPTKMTDDILSEPLIGYPMDKIRSLDIDDQEDLMLAEAVIKYGV